jgi:hypothetical protein
MTKYMSRNVVDSGITAHYRWGLLVSIRGGSLTAYNDEAGYRRHAEVRSVRPSSATHPTAYLVRAPVATTKSICRHTVQHAQKAWLYERMRTSLSTRLFPLPSPREPENAQQEARCSPTGLSAARLQKPAQHDRGHNIACTVRRGVRKRDVLRAGREVNVGLTLEPAPW